MARPEYIPDKPIPGKPLRLILPIAAALLVVVAGVLIYTLVSPMFGRGGMPAASGGNGATGMTVDYATEAAGQGAKDGIVNSPLRITLRVPYNGMDDSMINTASVQLLDENGNPAPYGGKALDPFLLQPTYEVGVWDYKTSVPSTPGKYHAHVVLAFRASGGATPTPQSQDFPATVIEAKAETSSPVTSGYVFTQDSNLWILSTDTKRQRRLTYFNTESEYADNASWAPDGKTIVFSYTPKFDLSQLPTTDLWTVNADGTNAHPLLAHGDNESLYEPAYSTDGKYIYFTAEKLDMSSTNYDANGQPVGERGIDRLEVVTGKREHWKSNAHMPVQGGPTGSIVYLGTPQAASTDASGPPGARMVREDPANSGSTPAVLADDTTFQAFYGPTTSPDGSRLVFAAIEVPKPAPNGGFDLFRWLGLAPETAYAHGLPWDLYIVGTDGAAKPLRITNMSEDQPHAAWLDNSTIAFMGVTGLYKLQLAPDGNPTGKPQKIHDGAPHGGLSWHAP